jgi:hypothetical protein
MERPRPDDDSGIEQDPAADSGAERKPRDPKSRQPEVTPLDEDKHAEEGIEVKET